MIHPYLIWPQETIAPVILKFSSTWYQLDWDDTWVSLHWLDHESIRDVISETAINWENLCRPSGQETVLRLLSLAIELCDVSMKFHFGQMEKFTRMPPYWKPWDAFLLEPSNRMILKYQPQLCPNTLTEHSLQMFLYAETSFHTYNLRNIQQSRW